MNSPWSVLFITLPSFLDDLTEPSLREECPGQAMERNPNEEAWISTGQMKMLFRHAEFKTGHLGTVHHHKAKDPHLMNPNQSGKDSSNKKPQTVFSMIHDISLHFLPIVCNFNFSWCGSSIFTHRTSIFLASPMGFSHTWIFPLSREDSFGQCWQYVLQFRIRWGSYVPSLEVRMEHHLNHSVMGVQDRLRKNFFSPRALKGGGYW